MSPTNHQVFKIITPTEVVAPILISIPHVGVHVPSSIKSTMNDEIAASLDDTDFLVDELYDFAADLGITVIKSHYSRYVIDLNRNPENERLYNDGRNATALAPTVDFHRNEIYKSSAHRPNHQEIKRRLDSYYYPYHKEIDSQLSQFKAEFGQALLFDAHSIKRNIPQIWDRDFADLILGDNEGLSSDLKYVNTCLDILSKTDFSLEHNVPFKGGFITRKYGKPREYIHALQLEMSKDLYLDENNQISNLRQFEILKGKLKELFTALIAKLTT